ncbi:MAG: hypothetical protein R2707_09770 [Acidimicrobiales bacterium]
MSIQIPVGEIEAAAADFGDSAYVLVSSTDGPPRVTHSIVGFDGGDMIVSIGRRAAAALAHNSAVSVLWPATDDQSMSLIVDGTAVAPVDADGGEVRITPSGAVRHRPATG